MWNSKLEWQKNDWNHIGFNKLNILYHCIIRSFFYLSSGQPSLDCTFLLYCSYLLHGKALRWVRINFSQSYISTNEYEYFSKTELEKVFKKFYGFLICLDTQFKRAVSLSEPIYTAKVILGIYFAKIVIDNICNCVLLFLGVNFLFLAPLIYKFKKDEIDGLKKQACTKAKELFALVESKIPRYVEKQKKN